MTEKTVKGLDVRPILARGEKPMGAILAAAASLAPEQALDLITPFEPVPLYRMLEQKGLRHESTARNDGHWIVRFSRPTGDLVRLDLANQPASSAIGPIVTALSGLNSGQCLDAILAEYPRDLAELLQENGVPFTCSQSEESRWNIRIQKP